MQPPSLSVRSAFAPVLFVNVETGEYVVIGIFSFAQGPDGEARCRFVDELPPDPILPAVVQDMQAVRTSDALFKYASQHFSSQTSVQLGQAIPSGLGLMETLDKAWSLLV